MGALWSLGLCVGSVLTSFGFPLIFSCRSNGNHNLLCEPKRFSNVRSVKENKQETLAATNRAHLWAELGIWLPVYKVWDTMLAGQQPRAFSWSFDVQPQERAALLLVHRHFGINGFFIYVSHDIKGTHLHDWNRNMSPLPCVHACVRSWEVLSDDNTIRWRSAQEEVDMELALANFHVFCLLTLSMHSLLRLEKKSYKRTHCSLGIGPASCLISYSSGSA